MPTAPTLINIRSSSQDLDGRRPIAGGMPSYQEGNEEYAWGYNKCLKWYKHDAAKPAAWWKDKILADHERYHYHMDGSVHRRPPAGWIEAMYEMWYAATDRENTRASVDAARDKLQRELGPREFTLTFSPAWYADNETAKDAMRVAIDKLTRYYKHEIIEFHAIGEYTEAGRPHVHCYYELDGGTKITDKNFKRAWTHWNPRKKLGSGHQGGHHANIRSKSDFLGYIEKDLDTAWMNLHITRDASTNDRTPQTRRSVLQEETDGKEASSDEARSDSSSQGSEASSE